MKRISKTKEDFGWAKWDAETIKRVAREILDKKKGILDEIKKLSDSELNFENILYAFERSNDVMEPCNYFSILMNASPDESVRKAAEESIKIIDRENIDLGYDPDVYKVFKKYADTNPVLEGEDKKLFDDSVKVYRRMGMELPDEQREILKNKIKRMNDLATDFALNIQNYDDYILATLEELEGLPEHFIEGLARNDDGRYQVSLKYPEIGPFMQNAVRAEKRKELMDKALRKGGEKNVAIAKELLELRKSGAQLLGYKSHGDYMTELRMAKNSEKVTKFLSGLMAKLQSFVDEDYRVLLDYKRRKFDAETSDLKYYETGFIAEQLKKEKFSIDSEKIRQYFPLDHVLNEMFKVYGELFGISFSKTDFILWHDDAVAYEVKNVQDQGTVGYCILDLHPRPKKFGHMACWPVVSGRLDNFGSGNFVTPVTAILGNFNKPTASRPSLLSHDELETLYHEFGHALHNLMSKTKYACSAGRLVVSDFMEVPSQMMEYWVWEPSLIARFSKHYQTGEPLDSETVAGMIASKNYLIAWATMRQLIYSFFDIAVHGENYPEDLAQFCNNLIEKHQYIKLPPNLFPAGFGHFAGYDAGYYSYMWSQVIAADFFHKFKNSGLLNPDTGREYRDKVLAVGGSRDEVETVRDFLGRDFSDDAYLEEIGLKG